MKEYTIKIIRNGITHYVPALRSCIESASFAHALASFVSRHFTGDTVDIVLFADDKVVYAADYENGTMCGIISLDFEQPDSPLLKLWR